MSSKVRVNSTWTLLVVEVKRSAEDFVVSLLFELGTTGLVTLEEKTESIRLGAYFDEEKDAREIKESVEVGFEQAGYSDSLITISTLSVADEDWMQKWKEGFEAVSIGKRLIVAPSWKLPPNKEGSVLIQIDPGMAFGTGTHETTRLCLEAIERHWRGGTLLDVGTGTGILAIAAALLVPASLIVAIDVDPQAMEVARDNVQINGVSSSVELLEAQPRHLTGRIFDVVVANLTAEVIEEQLEDLLDLLSTDGIMILSGILVGFADDVERALTAVRLVLIERCIAGEWSALVVKRVHA